MNISKLHKSMLLLVAAATIVSQVSAMGDDEYSIWQEVKALFTPKVEKPTTLQWAWNGLKSSPSTVLNFAKDSWNNHPYYTAAAGLGTVAAAGLTYAGYKYFKADSKVATKEGKKDKQAKKDGKKSSKLATTAKVGAGLGAAAGIAYAGYNGYLTPVYNAVATRVAPYLTVKAAGIATGATVGAAGLGLGAKKAYNWATAKNDKQEAQGQEPKSGKKQQPIVETDKTQKALLTKVVDGITVKGTDVKVSETIEADLTKLADSFGENHIVAQTCLEILGNIKVIASEKALAKRKGAISALNKNISHLKNLTGTK
jgi:uncharacterized membrane protein YebE (DUF533 family)